MCLYEKAEKMRLSLQALAFGNRAEAIDVRTWNPTQRIVDGLLSEQLNLHCYPVILCFSSPTTSFYLSIDPRRFGAG